jgi:response regulator RpfG family c-di-GMP phosphodiesterase
MTKEINHGGSKNKLHSMHVFLLDDNPSSCSMIGGMIALNVANVTMCRCIQEAYKILSNTSPDIIISRYFLADDLLATYFF